MTPRRRHDDMRRARPSALEWTLVLAAIVALLVLLQW
jgi:hypothetical protein